MSILTRCWRVAATASLVVLPSLCAPSAQASVVVTGTRVIYPADAREVTVRLTNQDNFPNAVQAWIDVDDPASTPADADAPFVVNPAISRLAPGSGQRLRIMFTGAALPQDRESLFHLNVLQIPPMNASTADRNQMLLLMRNRLKLFYRPQGMAGSPEQLAERLQFVLVPSGQQWHVRVDNPTGFHASFGGATLRIGEQQWTLKAAMVAPKSSAQWVPQSPSALPGGEPVLQAQLINDYGARLDLRHVLPR
ncbi:MAG: fimbrial biogenesis chaperone [Stenotrophomonas sp.]|uniref:fimbrial biogenesis chaperone n=1 Tax=Stenotrophomonas sp. TaxID=69392 RepID=UPI003D6C8D5B